MGISTNQRIQYHVSSNKHHSRKRPRTLSCGASSSVPSLRKRSQPRRNLLRCQQSRKLGNGRRYRFLLLIKIFHFTNGQSTRYSGSIAFAIASRSTIQKEGKEGPQATQTTTTAYNRTNGQVAMPILSIQGWLPCGSLLSIQPRYSINTL